MLAEILTCPRCASLVAAGARFCASCGASVSELPREERRVVTVLFGDLSGFTELMERRDAEEVKGIIDRAFDLLAETITSYGGRVDKIIGDEIMAVFGAPQAHEDDAERAVRAALAMQRALAEFSVESERQRDIRLRMHIGLNTGEVVAGFVGGNDSYTVLGDVVNTARRIETAAEAGQILVGEATHAATQTAIAYGYVGEVTAKGKRLPVPVWEALSERALPGVRTAHRAPLIGRDEELALLESMAAMTKRDGKPMVATIVGDAGMGKSRLASEFAKRWGASGVRVLHGRSLPYGTASPAFAIEEVLRAALMLDARTPADRARALVAERLELDDMGADAEQIYTLLGITDGARDLPGAQRDTTPRASPLLEPAIAVLERIAQREEMLVLALHELHWAEDAVLDMVQRLARGARSPLFVICLARPELLTRRPDWSGGPGSALLTLGPLPRARAETLLDTLAPSLEPGVRAGVLERAGGNPFYLEEMARLLIEQDRDGAHEIVVPRTVQALVTARLDGLAPATKRLVQDAAVVGERFWAGALRSLSSAALPDDVAAFTEDPALAALCAAEFIERVDEPMLPSEPEYRFRQTIVRDVAYGSVPKHVRARQHALVGAWLEDVTCACGRERDFYDLVAHNFERAATLARDVGEEVPGAATKAREYLVRAGELALGMDAAAAASDFFQRALPFATDGPDRLHLSIHAAEALVGSWQHDAAAEHLTVALAEARRLGDRAAEGKALRLLGDSYRMCGNADAAREPIERGLEIAKEVGDGREEAEGLRSRGLIDSFAGRWSPAALWFRQALARYRDLEDQRGEAWALSNLGWAELALGRLDEAIDYLNEAAALFETLGDTEGVGWSMGLRAWALLYMARLKEADSVASDIEAMLGTSAALRSHSTGFAGLMQLILRAHVWVMLGRLNDGTELASSAVAEAERRGLAFGRAIGRYPVFFAAILRRRLADAHAVLEEGDRAARESADPTYRGQFEFARAWLALEEKRHEDVERFLQDAVESGAQGIGDHSAAQWLRAAALHGRGRNAEARALLESSSSRRTLTLVSPAIGRALLAEILIADGEAARAVSVAQAALDETGEDLVARITVSWALGRALLADGKAVDAEGVLREGLRLLEDTDWDTEWVRGFAVLARALDAQRRHDESSEAMDRARALLDALGPGVDTDPLRALLLG